MSSKYVRNKKQNPVLKQTKNIIAWLTIPSLLLYVINVYSGLFNSFAPLLSEYLSDIIIILLVIILVPRIFRYIRAFYKRVFLLKNLRKVCADKGYRYIKIHSPILSLFYNSDDAEIAVVTDKKLYAVNFYTCISRKTALDFNSENTVTVIHTILKSFPPIRRTKYYAVNDISDPALLSFSLPIEKILLMNPTPYKITATTSHSSIIVDNYEKMFGYLFFNGTGFCNMLDRL